MNQPSKERLRVLIFGRGMTAELTAAALATGLGGAATCIRVGSVAPAPDDILFGNAAGPSAYDFFRSIGLTEPRLFLGAPTSFSFGTKFDDWPTPGRSWLQSFQAPIETLFGVPFHQFLRERSEGLSPYLIAAAAAEAGKFAHPPEEQGHPLAKAEYGHHISPEALTALVGRHPAVTAQERYLSDGAEVMVEDGEIKGLKLVDGRTIEADLYVDCSGTERKLASAVGGRFATERSLSAANSQAALTSPPPAYRTVSLQSFGYDIDTPLQDRISKLRVFHPDQKKDAIGDEEALTFETGHLGEAWVGNCVAIGLASAVLEPLTPAPMMLLERAIQRLVELAPDADDMAVERREFNRLHANDTKNAALFTRALFVGDDFPDTPFWAETQVAETPPELDRKLKQFASRGVLVQYDHEPFDAEDWAVQHFGIGRRPSRQDAQVDQLPEQDIERALMTMRTTVDKVVAAMPPHHVYLAKFKDYLTRKNLDPS